MENKNVLVVGLGISGIASVKALDSLGAKVAAYDGQDREKMEKAIEVLKDISVDFYFNDLNFDEKIFDFAIKSPGIKFNTPIMEKLVSSGVKIIGDLEAGFNVTNNKFITITGTNGKTTTTTLVGEILKYANKDHKITGNIGSGAFYDALVSKKDEILVVEASSFQLESTFDFKPHVSIITNLTPDHLDWHMTEDNYYKAKLKITANQDQNDFCILNVEDDTIKKYAVDLKTNVIYFSSKRELNEGVFIRDGEIIYKYKGEDSVVMKVEDVFIPGEHNLENVLAACGATKVLGIDNKSINEAISNFKGVEHRLEYVETYNNVKFYNDSKGTNPDASIKGIEGLKAPLILIAGGYEKNSVYDDFVNSFNNKVKTLILLGETKEKIKDCCLKYSFNNIHLVKNMDEAVKLSFELSTAGDTVLLSPACASWDMYANYELRGKDFKERVKFYGESSQKK